ncbi:hypothetical protein COCSUDRAFT_64161 [Coccomyxa subellipsoidea C-169]|uniref:LMBR1-domain-containing protein n=1 Tax=Coccomyxa subellipsoidea (strain C-169) TaxID=574566 RepID=I0Z9H7_COCSC|nr:hypothetical protein COCSUDRAFT_64161 [Coccomyxa subellipsoidea C-169]EIE27296.1 hypothetical protein COCSUDRAFT_64161 [Coccomyxa subellipsoidea C-169]|eukprot:XP_005651840.1 hypothetical protein COCSUDRAFT_64161 [Coccomyxa subellipsoidea C-169]
MTSISIIAIVPIDVWVTLNGGNNKSVFIMWAICYWATQLLTWFLIPMSQGFSDAGDFTVLGRLVSSLKQNLTYYLSIAVAGLVGIGLLLISGSLHAGDLLPLAMLLSNTYGELETNLGWDANSLAGNDDRVGRAGEKLEDAVVEMTRVATVVEATSQPMPRRDPLRKYMDIIYREAEEGSPIKPGQALRDERGRVNLDDLTDTDLDYGCDEKSLASLRRRLKRAINTYDGLLAEYVDAVKLAMELDIIIKCKTAGDYSLASSTDSATPVSGFTKTWRMYSCTAKPWVTRVLACVLGAVSFLIVWSEATIASGTNPDLSPFSHMVNGGAQSEAMTQLLTSLPLAYMATCCYYSLFKLGMFSFYHVVPHATNAHSLLMNAAQVTRFAAPLAYNYLHVIRMHEYLGPDKATVFAQEMGTAIRDVPVFGTNFNTCFLNVWDSLARLCIPKRYRFDEDAGSDENTERGRLLLRQEQEAHGRGLPWGAGLGLWGDTEAGLLNDAARARTLTARGLDSSIGSNQRGQSAGFRTTEMSQAMDTGPPGASQAWPPWTSRGAGAGSLGASSSKGSLKNLTPPAAVPSASPPLNRSLLRNKYAGSADSTASDGGGASSLDEMFQRLHRAGEGARIDDEPAGAHASVLGGASDSSQEDSRRGWKRSWK